MARTKGSGWGAGPMLWQLCPKCNNKRALYDPIPTAEWHDPFRCTRCKDDHDNSFRFDSTTLIKKSHPQIIPSPQNTSKII